MLERATSCILRADNTNRLIMAISLLNPDRKIGISYGDKQPKLDPKFSFDNPKFRSAIADNSGQYVPAEFDSEEAYSLYKRTISGGGSSDPSFGIG